MLVQLIFAAVIHELGHITALAALGRKFRLNPHWWGITILPVRVGTMRGTDYAHVALAGIWTGASALLILSASPLTAATYFVMCCIDFGIIFEMLSVPKAVRQTSLLNIQSWNYWQLAKKR
jgi:hypothetical protein